MSSSPEKPAHIKGAALQDFYAWYAGENGAARMSAIWLHLSPTTREEVGASYDKVLPFRWYTAPSILELLDRTVEGHTPEEQERMAREGARVVIAQTLRGLYKAIFVTLVTPRRYLRNTHRVWASFHDTGRSEGIEVGPGHHRLELKGWRAYHPFIERLNGHAGKEIYEAMACRNVSFTQARRADPGGTTYVTDLFFEI